MMNEYPLLYQFYVPRTHRLRVFLSILCTHRLHAFLSSLGSRDGAVVVGRYALDRVKQQKMAGHAAEPHDPHAPPPLKGSASAPSV